MSAPRNFKMLKKIKQLENNIKETSKSPCGELILWEGNKLIENNGKFNYLGIYYALPECLLNKFPLKIGFTRKYRLMIDYTDNKTEGSIYISLKPPSTANDPFEKQITFPYTWGATTDGVRKSSISEEINFSGLNHVEISTTPDWATGGAVRLYKVSILVYDILE